MTPTNAELDRRIADAVGVVFANLNDDNGQFEGMCIEQGLLYRCHCGLNVPIDQSECDECGRSMPPADDDDDDDDEPDEDDYITKDYLTFYQRGKAVVSVADADLWPDAVKDHMASQNFWPNVWLEGERGGYDLLDTTTGNFAE